MADDLVVRAGGFLLELVRKGLHFDELMRGDRILGIGWI